jgi:hypothetical protein
MTDRRRQRPSPARRSKWTVTEDEQLRNAVDQWGTDSWQCVGKFVPGRTGKQCRERWLGQLAPTVSRESWLTEDDFKLVRLHAEIGNKWAAIASKMPGRSAVSVKNRWSWLLRHNVRMTLMTTVSLRQAEIHTKGSREVFEPLFMDDGLFGSRFQEFQAKMLPDCTRF